MRKNVLVTGSSRGIGKSIAKKFLLADFNVIINANKSVDELNRTLEEFQSLSKNIMAIRADVSDYSQCISMFEQINKNFGDVDILINNAGISYVGLFNQMSPQQWKNVLDTNLNSVINCSHIAIQSMINKHSGIIINISSVWGNVGASCETIYSASKGAVNLFTKSLAKELAPSNIRINAIACGVIDTQMNNNLTAQEKIDLADQIPVGYFGKADDVADLAFFLASHKANYITGQILNLDGGWI